MAKEATCPICGAAADSWRHSLLDCNMAKAVWSLREDDTVTALFGDETSDAKLWLMNLCDTLKQDQFIQVLVTLWAIWWARSKVIHEGEFQSPLSTHMFIKRYLQDLALCNPVVPRASCTAGRQKAVWCRPPAGVLKANADAAVAKNGNKGAVGVLCRNSQGDFMGASAMVFDGITDPVVLEAMACREAMVIAEDLAAVKVVFVSDCLGVVNDINLALCSGKHGMIVKEILARRSKFQESVFSHERREANGEAHRLARTALSLAPGRHVWLCNPPSDFCIPMNIE